MINSKNIIWKAITNAFDAVKPSRFRVNEQDLSNSRTLGVSEFATLKRMARESMLNNPYAISIIDVLTNSIVGKTGIQIEATPKNKDGTVNKKLAEEIQKHWNRFLNNADINGYTFSQIQRFICRRWLIDGEVFIQHIDGYFEDRKIPYAIVVLDSDRIVNTSGDNITCGLVKDQYFRTTGYCVAKNTSAYSSSFEYEIKPADKITQIAFREYPDQPRGITIFHAVFNDLRDLLDYENAEKQKAKNQASIVASIYTTDHYEPPPFSDIADDDTEEEEKTAVNRSEKKVKGQQIEYRAGMTFVNLEDGERIELHEVKGPSPYMERFVYQLLRKIASGVGVAFSVMARIYDHNYSAQRQELIDAWGGYETKQNEIACQGISPIYQRFVRNLLSSGVIAITGDIDPNEIVNAIYTFPVKPWIDPKKEIDAEARAIEIGMKSVTQVIRERGGNPHEVFESIKKEREEYPFLSKEIEIEEEKTVALDDESVKTTA